MRTFEVQSLRIERDIFKDKVKASQFCSKFLDNDEKVVFFTSIPSLACFVWLFDVVSTGLPKYPVLCSQDAFLLTLLSLVAERGVVPPGKVIYETK